MLLFPLANSMATLEIVTSPNELPHRLLDLDGQRCELRVLRELLVVRENAGLDLLRGVVIGLLDPRRHDCLRSNRQGLLLVRPFVLELLVILDGLLELLANELVDLDDVRDRNRGRRAPGLALNEECSRTRSSEKYFLYNEFPEVVITCYYQMRNAYSQATANTPF